MSAEVQSSEPGTESAPSPTPNFTTAQELQETLRWALPHLGAMAEAYFQSVSSKEGFRIMERAIPALAILKNCAKARLCEDMHKAALRDELERLLQVFDPHGIVSKYDQTRAVLDQCGKGGAR